MLQRWGETKKPVDAHRVALSCLLLPQSARDQKLPVQLAEWSATAAPKDRWCLIARGAGLYRAGHSREAVQQLLQVLKSWPEDPCAVAGTDGGPIVTWLLLALAQHSLGKVDDARPWLTRAVRMMDQELAQKRIGPLRQQSHVWAMCLILRHEAEGLLNSHGR
jgi:hypothetical protein